MRIGVWIILFAVAVAVGADWPQWRGPYDNGTGEADNLPAVLDANSLLWSVPLPGPSAATPVIVDGRVYLPSTETDSNRLLGLCLDGAGGQRLWQTVLVDSDQKAAPLNTLASCSPCADASGVVFLLGEGTLVKLDLQGKRLWQRNLIDDYGPLSIKFGFSSSPLLLDGRLYIAVMRYPEAKAIKDLASYLLCVDADTGETIFKVDRPSDARAESTNAYTTPLAVTIDGQRQILVYGADYLTGHDPADGRQLWRFLYATDRKPMDRLIPTPVTDGRRLFCSYPRGTQVFAVDLAVAARGEPPVLWTCEATGSDVNCPLLLDGSLYVIDEKKKTLTCLAAETGQVRWVGQLDKRDVYYASLVAADGKLYAVNRKGVVTVVAADAGHFRILSTSDLGEHPVDSTPAIADDKLYLRTAERLHCFGRR